jgi:uncharacterized protein
VSEWACDSYNNNTQLEYRFASEQMASLVDAVKSRDTRQLETLLHAAPVTADERDEQGRTALSWAAETGDVEILRLLLSRDDVDVDLADYSAPFHTPLFYAVDQVREKAVVLLISHGASVMGPPELEHALLVHAARRGGRKIMPLLLDRLLQSASPQSGVTSPSKAIAHLLTVAWNHQFSWLSKLLLDNQQYVSILDGDARTPLSWVVGRAGISVARIRDLVDRDEFFDILDHHGRTPLSWAAEAGNFNAVKALLDRGANISLTKERNGNSALLRAAKLGRTSVVKLLLEQKDQHTSAESLTAALTAAAVKGHVRTVQVLLDHGAHFRPELADEVMARIQEALQSTEGSAENTDDFRDRLLDTHLLLHARYSEETLQTDRRHEADAADSNFFATVTKISEGDATDIVSDRVSVASLFDSGWKRTNNKHTPAWRAGCQWIHLPANNVRPGTASPLFHESAIHTPILTSVADGMGRGTMQSPACMPYLPT